MDFPPNPQPPSCHIIHKLPLEIRLGIYRHILEPVSYPHPNKRWGPPFPRAMRTPALARTCRQLRWETLSVCLGDNTICVEIWDLNPLDITYLKTWLQHLGANVRLIRRFVIRHQVDFNLRRLMGLRFGGPVRHEHVTTAWAKTFFSVSDLNHNSGTVMVHCDFGTEANLGDELPASRTCRCPLSSRLVQESALPSVSPPELDCALTRAVYGFIRLMEIESVGGTVDYYGPRTLRKHTEQDWPLCETCNLPKWFLSGPKVFVGGHKPDFVAHEQQCNPM